MESGKVYNGHINSFPNVNPIVGGGAGFFFGTTVMYRLVESDGKNQRIES